MSAGKLRDQYDWIVLGDDPGALLGGCLAARLGLSVLILPRTPSLGVMSTKNDKFLDPENSLLLGLGPVEGRASLLGRCLDQLGMTEREKALFVDDQALPQILTPSARSRTTGSHVEFNAQLKGEMGEAVFRKTGWGQALAHAEKEIYAFWTRLPESRMRFQVKASEEHPDAPSFNLKKMISGARSLRAKLRAKIVGNAVPTAILRSGRGLKEGAIARQWFSSRRLSDADLVNLGGEFFEGVWAGLSGSSALGVHQCHVLQLAALRAGGVSVVGGISAFRDLLMELAKRNGADVIPDHECQAIFVQHGKFIGVQSQGRGGMIGGGGAMMGAPIASLPFVSTGRGSGVSPSCESPVLANGWKFTISISVHPEAIPPGATRRLVWQEAGAPFLEVELTRGQDYGFSEHKASHSVILARTLMPLTEESLTPQFQRLTAARMLRKLSEIFPFLDYHIEWIYPDFRTGEIHEFTETYGFKSLNEIPPNLLTYESPGHGVRSAVDGLFLSSKESFPELGSLGYAVSAIEAVTWAARRASLPGPFVTSAVSIALAASAAEASPEE